MKYPVKAEDMFWIGCFPVNINNQFENYIYSRDEEELTEEEQRIIESGWKERQTYFEELILSVCKGEKERPVWFDMQTDDDGSETTLYIIPKMEEYKEVAEALKKFLYSTYHEAVYNG
jgi:hypothetical protein